MKIEIILVLIVIVIVLIDFIVKSIKKDSPEISTYKKNKSFINFDFIFKRKKNIILSLIFIAIIKVVIHYTIYPDKVFGRKVKIITEIGYYINNIFERNLNLFIPSTIIVLLIAWFFNDKIKAR